MRDEVVSDWPIPPGEFLSDELEARGMSQEELAVQMGVPVGVIHEIIQGRQSITADTALGLQRVLGIPGRMWLGLEHMYQLALVKSRCEREGIPF